MIYLRVCLILLLSSFLFAVIALADVIKSPGGKKDMSNKSEIATLGGGCFWCVEAIFQRLKGVEKVESGYAGGSMEDPSYESVSGGTSGHAEVIQVHFDPNIVSFADILEVFFHLHDPTTLNKQGADIGSQYRSIILYHDQAQQKTAEEVKKKIAQSGLWKDPIVTEVQALDKFYRAEDYHQNYFNRNPSQPYCSLVIGPKIKKLEKDFAAKLK